jgi:uncharacterized protein YlzI (FlbEa/FlbD family)
MKNLKFLDIKTLKELLNSIVTDSESLNKLFKETQIKTHYGIATPTEFILMNKSKLDLISYDIDVKKLEISQEKDPDNKKIKQSEIKILIKDYKHYFDLAEKSINEPIYVDADPTSYEYFIASEASADTFIQILEDKKNIFKPLIDSMIVDIANLKKSVQSQEKNIIIKKEGLEPELLDVDIRTLEGDKKEKISFYQNLRDKLNGDKNRLKTLIIESDILINFYNRMNETIKKIKPDYVIKNIKLK